MTAADYVRTSTPGIYRRGSGYVVKQRDRTGRMHARTAPTMGAAKREQSKLRAGSARGEIRVETRDRFDTYALTWIDTYQGRTSRGLRESTRAEYRHALIKHAIPFFHRMRITDITPPDIRKYVRHCSESGLGTHGVKNALGPVKAMLATAFDDGDIRVNPAANVRVILPVDDSANGVRALTETELDRLITEVPSEWRPLVQFLASTGLRIGEASELRWHDVDLQGRNVSPPAEWRRCQQPTRRTRQLMATRASVRV